VAREVKLREKESIMKPEKKSDEVYIDVTEEQYRAMQAEGIDEEALLEPGRHKFVRGLFKKMHPEYDLRRRSKEMTERILTLEEVGERTVGDLLHEVASERAAMTVVLGDGEMVVIQPAPALKPLPELEGFVPEGWKDAVYGE
jgi:hypothetical protein